MRIGVYVDEANISRNGGRGMQYKVLKAFACREGGDTVRLNTYVAFDEERAEADLVYRRNAYNFHSALRDAGFKVVQKPVQWFSTDDGGRVSKANVDLDMAVDALLQSDKLDRVVLCTGDGDFVQVVRALQNKGCRVDIVAFDNVSGDLRREADVFTSGYLVPSLLPLDGVRDADWGRQNGKARGVCYFHSTDKPFGFFRYFVSDKSGAMVEQTIYFFDKNLPATVSPRDLPSRQVIFEFAIHPSGTKGRENEVNAFDIKVISRG